MYYVHSNMQCILARCIVDVTVIPLNIKSTRDADKTEKCKIEMFQAQFEQQFALLDEKSFDIYVIISKEVFW